MQKTQFEKAEPIIQKIRELEEKLESIDLPAECYRVELATTSGRKVLVDSEMIGSIGISKLIICLKNCIDFEIELLNKKMEEI